MQRYFIRNENKLSNQISITDSNDIHHMQTVMRMTPGTQIVCTDENGQAYQCTIESIMEAQITVSIDQHLDNQTEMPIEVTIFQGMPKKNKLELIIQKGTELGAAGFQLFQADRSIVKWDKRKTAEKLKRFEKIALEASEQCARASVPAVESVPTIEEILKNKDKYDIMLFAYEQEAKTAESRSIANALAACQTGMRIGIFIGPEGGFSEREAALLNEQGVKSIRLGPRILRTETAPLYALACISYHFEEMRCP